MLRTNLDAWRATLFVTLGLNASGCGMAADGDSVEADHDAPDAAPTRTDADSDSNAAVLPAMLRCENEVPSAADPGLTLCSNGIVHRPAPPAANCSDCSATSPTLGAVRDSCGSDGDCAPGMLCIASAEFELTSPCPDSSMLQSSVRRYFACQMLEDECGADSQCGAGWVCAVDSGRRRCNPEPIVIGCPIPGRPFLVGGEERLASVRSASDWSGPVLAAPAELTPDLCASLRDYWLMVALREHASVAAFARFTLQLLQLGAPHDLCLASQRAMRDEIEHARRCFGLASRYAREALGPGPLAIDGAVEAASLAQIVLLTFREGCIGETSAALEAAEALALASDPEVQGALMLIARDERRHAKLAWRFLAWALEHDVTGEVRAVLLAELERLRAQVRSRDRNAEATTADRSAALGTHVGENADAEAAACASAPVPLVQHGHTSPERCRMLSELAIREVVLPCTERLLATRVRQQPARRDNLECSA